MQDMKPIQAGKRRENGIFLAGMALLSAMLWLRFYDWRFFRHAYVNPLMNRAGMRLAVTCLLGIQLLGYDWEVLSKVSEAWRRKTYGWLILLTVTLCPNYLCDSYYGTADIYAFCCLIAALWVIMRGWHPAFVIPLAWLMFWIDPKSATYTGAILFFVLWFESWRTHSARWLVADALVVMIGGVCALYSWAHGGLAFDVQLRVKPGVFFMTLFIAVPLVLLALYLLRRVIRSADSGGRILWGFLPVMAAGAVAFWALLRDYQRAVVFGLLITEFVSLHAMAQREPHFMKALDNTEDLLDRIHLPAVLIVVYLFLPLTFWFSGREQPFFDLIRELSF